MPPRVHVRLPDDDRMWVETLAGKQGVSLSRVIFCALAYYRAAVEAGRVAAPEPDPAFHSAEGDDPQDPPGDTDDQAQEQRVKRS